MTSTNTQQETAIVLPPISEGSGGTHPGSLSVPNGILPPKVIGIIPSSKPTPPKPKPPTRSEPQPQVIQIAPSFGNLRDRAIGLSRKVMADLYMNGWPLPNGSEFTNRIQTRLQMPTSHSEKELWIHFRSGAFRFLCFKDVVAIRDEFAILHFHEKNLDDFIEHEKENEAKYGEDFTKWPSIAPQVIQEVSEELAILANQISVKQP